MTAATYTNPAAIPGVVRLRTGRLALLLLGTLAVLAGGGYLVLSTLGTKALSAPATTVASPSWLTEPVAYPPTPARPVASPVEADADLKKHLAALHQEMQAQRLALDALKKRPTAPLPAKPSPPPAPPRPPTPHGAMLFVSHEYKEPQGGPQAHEYTLAPGATKLPCIIETTIISDVEGYFTCRVTTNVYDTKTGRHLLVPQGSTILGNDQASTLLYGSNRLDTVALTLTLPDDRSVDLGRAPITDQDGVAGLTGDVNNHYLKLFGAVIIGGALKGGISAVQIAATEAAGAGQVTQGLTTLGTQATTRVTQPHINIRPTISKPGGDLALILLIKPLHLPAMWQGAPAHHGGIYDEGRTVSTQSPTRQRRPGETAPGNRPGRSTTARSDQAGAQ